MKKIILGILLVGTLAQAAEQPKEKSNAKWWLLGGGAAVATAVAVGASGGSSSDDKPEAPKAPAPAPEVPATPLEPSKPITNVGSYHVWEPTEDNEYCGEFRIGGEIYFMNKDGSLISPETMRYAGRIDENENGNYTLRNEKGETVEIIVDQTSTGYGQMYVETPNGRKAVTKEMNNTQALQDAKDSMNQAMDAQNERLDKQFAMNNAQITAQTSALAELDKAGDVAVGMGVGGTGEDTAISMSVAMKPTENTNLNANVTTTTDGEETSFGIGGGIKLGNMFK